jgi:hypothetical protein
MPTDPLLALTASLVSENPKAQAGNTLRTLMRVLGCAGAALLVLRDGEVDVFAVSGEMPLQELARARGIWQRLGSRDRAQVVTTAAYACVPVPHGPDPVAFAYLLQPRHKVSAADLKVFSQTLAQAIEASDAQPLGPVDQFLASAPRAEVERAQLLAALQEQDWNIMRVARQMELSRRTVYLWMERFGIRRPQPGRVGRPPKMIAVPAGRK